MKPSQRLTAEAFWNDLWSETADESSQRMGYHQRVLTEILAQLVADARKGSTCLEVGCGNSRYLPWLATRHGLEVAGLDYSPQGCRTAQARLQQAGVSAPIYQRDVLDWNEDLQGRFDYVFSFGVVEHFDDPMLVLTAMRRLLKPTGRILTVLPNVSPHSLNVQLFRLVGPRILAMHKLITLEQLRRFHEQAGFETVECRFAGMGISTMTDRKSLARRLLQQLVFRAMQVARKTWECLGSTPPVNSWTALYMVYHGKH